MLRQRYDTVKNYPWVHDQRSSLKHKCHLVMAKVKDLIDLCIMGGGKDH